MLTFLSITTIFFAWWGSSKIVGGKNIFWAIFWYVGLGGVVGTIVFLVNLMLFGIKFYRKHKFRLPQIISH